MNKIILLSKLENAVKKEFYKVNFDYLSEDLVKITIKNVDIYLFHIDKTFSIFNNRYSNKIRIIDYDYQLIDNLYNIILSIVK